MQYRTFGLFLAVIGAALLAWFGYGISNAQRSIADKLTQDYILTSVIMLYLGMKVWRSGSGAESQSSSTREIVGRVCCFVGLAMAALAACRVAPPIVGWIGIGIGVLGSLIGWGKRVPW